MIERLTQWGEWKRTRQTDLKADAKLIERAFRTLTKFDRLIMTNRFVTPLKFNRLTVQQIAEIEAAIILEIADRVANPTGKPVVLELLPTGLSHSEIAKKAGCSREYVGQCARAIQPTKRRPTPGS